MKIQITCSRCGFLAFISPHPVEVETSGWHFKGGPAGVPTCPACVGEEQCVTAQPKTKTASVATRHSA